MTGPFVLTQGMSLASAIIIGIFFGLFLERGGLGDPHKLTGIFYLTDFTVPKVMFTAIIVAAAGLYVLSDIGFIDMSRIWIVPTFFWPQIVGGAIFGAGFLISGYCPGTAVAGFASGRFDALVVLAGIIAGSFVFAFLYPYIEGFYALSPMGKTVLPGVFKTGHWVVIAVLAGLAVAMFLVMEIYERRKRLS